MVYVDYMLDDIVVNYQASVLVNDYCSTRIVVIMYVSECLSSRLNGRVPAFYLN